ESPNNSCEIYCTNSESNLSTATKDEPVLARL
ncbi:MAG: 6-pyruvoyl tetrahydropterin synthase, partial [Cyanobacteria bacterium J06628_3]